MKVLHLADLHIGKCILEHSLIEDQIYILDQILDIIINKKIDVILIAGDVYDKTIPSIEAVRLFSNFLTNLYNLKVKVFVISGNHDSKDRLTFGNELFYNNDIFIEGVYDGNIRKVSLNDRFGEFNIFMLPFVKPADVRKYYLEENIESYNDAVRCIINNLDIDKNSRNIIMVHQFVTAGGIEIERSDSEFISLGGIDNVDVSLFNQFDYVAMGHVHRGQKLTKDTIRYAGSPLKYSFSEVNHRKSVPIIEFEEKENIRVELVDLIPLRDMITIKGNLEDLLDKNFYQNINVDSYVNAIITDEDYIIDAIGKIRKVYKNVLRLEYDNIRVNGNVEYNDVKKENILSEFDMFNEFYKMQNNIDLDKNKIDIINNIINDIKEDGDL